MNDYSLIYFFYDYHYIPSNFFVKKTTFGLFEYIGSK